MQSKPQKDFNFNFIKEMNTSDWVYVAVILLLSFIAGYILDIEEGIINLGLVVFIGALVAGWGLRTRIAKRKQSKKG